MGLYRKDLKPTWRAEELLPARDGDFGLALLISRAVFIDPAAGPQGEPRYERSRNQWRHGRASVPVGVTARYSTGQRRRRPRWWFSVGDNGAGKSIPDEDRHWHVHRRSRGRSSSKAGRSSSHSPGERRRMGNRDDLTRTSPLARTARTWPPTVFSAGSR